MKKFIKILGVILLILLPLGFIFYWFGLRNPYEDELALNPKEIFGEDSSENEYLIRNATLIDVESGKAIPGSHILIKGDTISEIFHNEIPDTLASIEKFEASGKFIMPGLIDVHTHLAMQPQLGAGIVKDRDSLVTRVALEQFVRYGVTTILTVGGGGANDEEMVKLKKLEKTNRIVSPVIFSAGNCITAPGSHPITTIMRLKADTGPERLHLAGVTTIAEGEDPAPLIARKKDLGLDGVKIILEDGPAPWYPKPRLSKKTAQKIAGEANKHNLPVYVHAEGFQAHLDAVSISGTHGIMHSLMDTLIAQTSLPEQMKEKDIWYVPTLSILYGFQTIEKPDRLDDEFLAGVSKRALKSWKNPLIRFVFGQALKKIDLESVMANTFRNLSHVFKEGVLVCMGTDACTPFNFPGYGAHQEMELMVQAGLSNEDVLRIATVNGAKFLEVDHRLGTIEKGKLANLLILNENPLEKIGHTRSIDKVMLKGRMIESKIESKQMQ